jgi:hypothetical protein
VTRRRLSGSAGSVARTSLEVLVALGCLLFALETLSHRAFSPEPRYHAGVIAFALLAAALGLLPLVLHFAPRAGKVGIVLWLSTAILLLIVGWVTKT